jgi:rSAM/selenodomain-associated transferase 2
MQLSIIVPALNEARVIVGTLGLLQPLRGPGIEVLLVDGGSADGTPELARPLVDQVLCSARGRALQMNSGAAAARGAVLLFLHADTALPPEGSRLVLEGLAASGRHWGRFDVRLSGTRPLLRVVESAMNLRSRWSGIATGDQALFVTRELFVRIGGFPALPLMEDVALSSRCLQEGRPLCIRHPVVTSSRRWETHGIVRTIWLMWRLRLAYAMGADPVTLARRYHGARP